MKKYFKINSAGTHNKSLINVLILFFVVTLLLAISGAYYYQNQKEKIINERFEYLGSIANYKLSSISRWINVETSNLEILRASVDEIDLTYTNGNLSGKFSDLFKAIKKYYPSRKIYLVNENFNQLYSSINSGITRQDSIMVRASLDSNKVLFSDISEITASKTNIKFYLPFKKTAKQNAGIVLILAFDPQIVFDPILNKNFDKSPTTESLLLKTAGDSIIYLNKLRLLNEENESTFKESRRALLQTSAIKEHKGFAEGIDYKHDRVIAIIQKVPESAWFLLTKIDKSEFDKPVKDLAGFVLLSFISAELFFALVLFFLWKKNIAANLEKIYKTELEKIKLENRFESLVNGVKDMAIFVMDRNGNILTWNEGAENIKGYSAKEAIGKNFSIFYNSKSIKEELHKKLLAKAEKTGNAHDEGFRLKKDGSEFFASVDITALKDGDGNVYGFLKITRDLTEKRKIEEEIKNSRDFYLKLLEDFPNPVWRSGVDGKCNYFNKAWLNYTGRKLEEEYGDGWVENVHQDDKDKVIQDYYKAFQERRGFTMEYRLKNYSGHFRWQVDFGIPFYDTNNEFLGFFGSCYDVDDRKKYEDTINTLLRISEKLYSSLDINQIMDSLVTESIKLADAESGFACLIDEDKFKSDRYFNIDHWEYYERKLQCGDKLIEEFKSAKEGIITERIEEEFGHKFVKQALSTPLFGSNGELIGFFEIHNKKSNKNFTREDIDLLRAVARNASISIAKSLNYEKLRVAENQLRKSEAELRDLAAQIQYAREAERQSIAREVHDELGQLFTGINLNISLLSEILEQNKNPNVDEILNELKSVQQFVEKGIQSVRDISGSLRSYVLDHLGLIPAVSEYCREIERISNIKCDFETELENVNFADEKNIALFRIVQEAITNVIRHADATLIKINFNENDGYLKIMIEDNGKGISENHQEKGRHSMGILGMKERAIFLGGKITIDSVKEEGTKISLLVPLK